jgi:hypothetical protein
MWKVVSWQQTRPRTLTSRTSVNPLVLQLDFGQLDSNVVTRPLVIKISEHSHRNGKRRDNCYCKWFHQGILQFEFFRPLHLIPALRDPVMGPRHRVNGYRRD